MRPPPGRSTVRNTWSGRDSLGPHSPWVQLPSGRVSSEAKLSPATAAATVPSGEVRTVVSAPASCVRSTVVPSPSAQVSVTTPVAGSVVRVTSTVVPSPRVTSTDWLPSGRVVGTLLTTPPW
ncbi:hypothetical protein [Actinomycetospora aeridis]|uniref:Uncharacterized protein n=1 Tax=Actinomycetospora aeridis TaxID=3129231 RepID=A0ABU8ND83_9PSEU